MLQQIMLELLKVEIIVDSILAESGRIDAIRLDRGL